MMKAHSRKGKKQASRMARRCHDMHWYHMANLYFGTPDNCFIFKKFSICPFFCKDVDACSKVSEGHWTTLLMYYPDLFDRGDADEADHATH